MFRISRLRASFFKATIVAFAAIYLLFSVGVLKATHFCMGEEASVVLFSSDANHCFCEMFGERPGHDCCNDESQVIKIKDDQHGMAVYTIRIPQLYILDDLYTERLITSNAQQKIQQRALEMDDIPPLVPIFKSNCSFVFYDSEG